MSTSSCSWRKAIPYEKGAVVDIEDLLFTRERDYLIKCDTDQVVKVEQLQGRLIILHFVLLDPVENWRWTNTAELVELYNELFSSQEDGPLPFEVVFVPIHGCTIFKNELNERFYQVLSTMPWSAVPYSDVYSWERLANSFVASSDSGYHPFTVAISPAGVVLQLSIMPLIRAYGAAAYPFSEEKIMWLESEDDRVRNCPSLRDLLVSPQRDYVINNRGDKVNVSDLEDKVVGLYLYEDGCTNPDLTVFLEKVYRRREREGMNFEVVLIYIHDSPNTFGHTDGVSFWNRFETMPWLALPFKDINCKKVLRVFEYPLREYAFEFRQEEPDRSLVIIGPRGEFIERLGASVLMKIGIEAYPFTRKSAYMLQVEKIKKLKLRMLFGREDVFGQLCNSTSKKVSFSNINVRKTIIVLSDSCNTWMYSPFKMKIWSKYIECKGRSDEFEVIQIGGPDDEVVPWLKVASSRWFERVYKNARNIFSDIFRCGGHGILVFDRYGRVARATMNPERFEIEANDFPFRAGCLEEEVAGDLQMTCNWLYF